MKTKKIFAALIVAVSLITCSACGAKTNPSNITPSNVNKLEIFNTGLKLTQDQVMSKIKAEYLLENKGYKDSDEIISIITLSNDALIDSYLTLESATIDTVADYANSSRGKRELKKINTHQDELIDQLFKKGLIKSVEYRYSTIINAIAVKTTYGSFKKIKNIANVENTIISDTFNMPQAANVDPSEIVNLVDVYPTGIFNSSSVSYTGNGTAVAVLDSGFDCSHSVFQNTPEYTLIDEEDINNVLSETNAAKTTPTIKLTDVYYSKKIPFVYDYADKDTDVFPYDSEHGTHVAGIIGGKDSEITGVAVNTQLVLMKVFPDLNEGAKTEDILAALEDAVLLEVDAINMSLGSSCGFAREVDKVAINEVYDKINASGISLITAASNSYSSGFGGENGNTNKVTNPDSGTVGSPSTYYASLSVASISGIKSKYILANSERVIFFKESNALNGKENNFYKELFEDLREQGKIEDTDTSFECEYVTIPGVGSRINFQSVDIEGKIALVRRGDITFEEKAANAKAAGAIACIIYNNVEGDILMSMGKKDHIPTVSISREDGYNLALKDTGMMVFDLGNEAGPFMSDFSSWGPTPSLGLKPEITAHGGNIRSAIPGGGYDDLSGTSMACPNLCGIVVLIRQYVKETYPDLTIKEMSVLTNQLLMSTATIAVNEEGNPYSPRKQGSGLASLSNAVNTSAYLTVDNSDRTKLELGDDKKRTGVYELEFNVVNLKNKDLKYDVSLIAMTETVSTADDKYVAEKATLLNGTTIVNVEDKNLLNGTELTVPANKTVKLTITYTLSNADKKMLNNKFNYGMYIEGFGVLKAKDEGEIDLNIPFLAFYGDWTQAPMFDKTYYEVESEAYDGSIDEEDKLKADYYATLPYGSYLYNYIIPLGTYLYDVDESQYEKIPASLEKISVSNIFGTVDGISAIAAGLLRNAKEMHYTVTDKVTGKVVYSTIDYNANKAYSLGAGPYPYYYDTKIKATELDLLNNHEYEFKMLGYLDYEDGGISTNVRNSFSFDFTFDDEAPTLKDVSYEKIYDKSLKKDRYYVTMTVYDNHYVQSITPIIFTAEDSYTFLTEHPIPVYSVKGQDNIVRFEITDYLDNITYDAIFPSGLAFSIDDYALNSNIYLCELPGTRGDFKFTEDGKYDSPKMSTLKVEVGEAIDLTKYLATKDETALGDKTYLKYLMWESSNESILKVENGTIVGVKKGTATITVIEPMDLKKATIAIRVVEPTTSARQKSRINVSDESIEDIKFTYFDTLFAYSRAAQTSEIGQTGSKMFLSSIGNLSFYPGEKIQLHYSVDPWYVEDNYELEWKSSNPTVATVDEKGIIIGLKEGSTYITLSVKNTNLLARVRVEIKNEFVIENRALIAYKGLGGTVVIPDDEGILYIDSFAFCLYETDRTMEVTEEDYDANKIPSMNTSVTEVIIPEGVEEVRKYAFYNCVNLKKVTLPLSTKIIREYAFYKDAELVEINLSNIEVIGRNAFFGCSSLKDVDFSKVLTIGVSGFEGCTSLTTADLSALRNTGRRAFRDCTNLVNVTLGEHTKLAEQMFLNTGIETIDIYEKILIPSSAFAKCNNLKVVNIHSDLVEIGEKAFLDDINLDTINFFGSVDIINNEAFYNCDKLVKIVLPNSNVTIGNLCFASSDNLTTVEFKKDTLITNVLGTIFQNTNITTFIVDEENSNYSTSGNYLLSKDGKTIILAANVEYGDLVIDENYTTIGKSAFAGANISTLTITNKDTVIDDYAFANIEKLRVINLPAEAGVVIKNRVFTNSTILVEVNNLDKVVEIGEYAFANSNVKNIAIGANVKVLEGAFFNSNVTTVTLGANVDLGLGAFQNCKLLTTVNMPEDGGVKIGFGTFANSIKLATIDLTKTNGIIADQAFYGCESLTKIDLANVTIVGRYAFADCKMISTIKVPDVVEIHEGAFGRHNEKGGAPLIIGIVLPETLTFIGDGAFLGCEFLNNITIPSSVTTMSDYTFAYCVSLQEVVLNDKIDRIGKYAFAGCENLANINLENIKTIAEYAFAKCEVLSDVNLEKVETIETAAFANSGIGCTLELNNLKSVGDYAFQNTFIRSIKANNLETIGKFAFENNDYLQEFTFSQKLDTILEGAFYDCNFISIFKGNKDGEIITNGSINDKFMLDGGILYEVIVDNKYVLKSVPASYASTTLNVLNKTTKIERYAGNRNTIIEKIVLPDLLKEIGNYAFYDYKNLKEVEFKSLQAPSLESWYNSSETLKEDDPGYELAHKYFNLFGLELHYFTFIDLAGRKEPIKMILPKDTAISGYDSIVYELVFGKVENASYSDYVAMNENFVTFVESALKISKLSHITINEETLINNAYAAMDAITQDYKTYGYTDDEWNSYKDTVTKARQTLKEVKLSAAPKAVKDLQILIDELPDEFSASIIDNLFDIQNLINELQIRDRKILDLTKYNNLKFAYQEYTQNLKTEVTPIINGTASSFVALNLVGFTLLTAGALVAIRFIMFRKKDIK